MSSDSGPSLPDWEGSGAVMYPAAPCVLRASRIKKCVASLPMQLGKHVSKACPCILKEHVSDKCHNCDRTTSEGVRRQDQREQFSAKREHNQDT
jgi:hypothetical protein